MTNQPEITPSDAITAKSPSRMDGAARIAAERQRQIEVEGWDVEHDDAHVGAEINLAAAQYLDHAFWTALYPDEPESWDRRDLWPWAPTQFRGSMDPIRNLEKAGALIAAEIDRLLRLESK